MQKAIRIAILVGVIGFLAALVIFNALNPAPIDMTTWNDQMAKGDPATAKHHFVMYTDIFCPYCDKFSDAVAANLEHFEEHYIRDNNILFEIRVTDINYENGHSKNSRPAGEAAYCAAKQGKFWDYYYALLAQIFKDYHSKGIGVDPYSQKIPDLEDKYFYDVADTAKIDRAQLVSCMEKDEALAELDANTKKAQAAVGNGVPRFVFDKFKNDGFRGNWDTANDYEEVKLLMDAGLSTK